MTTPFTYEASSSQNDPFSDLLWQESQESERAEAKRHSAGTLSADIEAYLASTH